jgi:hypothetical protein
MTTIAKSEVLHNIKKCISMVLKVNGLVLVIFDHNFGTMYDKIKQLPDNSTITIEF